MKRTSFLRLKFVVKLRLSAAFLLSTVVGLIRIWFRENRLNRSRMGEIALRASINGYRESILLYIAAKLGLADLLVKGPRDSDELALLVGAHAPSLYRVLRGLVVLGLISEKQDGRFALTALGTWLLSDKRNSLRNSALLCGEGRYVVFGSLLKSVMTGKSAWTDLDTNFFDYSRKHPELDTIYNTAMRRHSKRIAQSVLAAYDFHSLNSVADIGGGHGGLLAAILKAYPTHTGILFDQPHVTDNALPYLEKAGVAERCRIVGGDFLNHIPTGANVLILKNILHNWDDERCITILRNCREALAQGGKILVIEGLMPARAEDNPGMIWLDLWMLAQMGGGERTEKRYREFLAEAGFAFTRALPIASQLWVIEAVYDNGTEP
jgi:hypothetical protein